MREKKYHARGNGHQGPLAHLAALTQIVFGDHACHHSFADRHCPDSALRAQYRPISVAFFWELTAMRPAV